MLDAEVQITTEVKFDSTLRVMDRKCHILLGKLRQYMMRHEWVWLWVDKVGLLLAFTCPNKLEISPIDYFDIRRELPVAG
jgi:hypothetical protein